MLRDVVATLPSLEVAVTTKVYVPATVGVPEMIPVEVSSDKPVGKPDAIDQVTGELQLLDDNV